MILKHLVRFRTERLIESLIPSVRGLLCFFALSLVSVTAAAPATAPTAPAHSMQVFACDRIFLLHIDGLPPAGDTEFDPDVPTCGLGATKDLKAKDFDEYDELDYLNARQLYPSISSTLRDGKLDVHLELPIDKNKFIYEASAVATDTKALRLEPVGDAQGPELLLSVGAVHDKVDRIGLKVINTPANQLLSEMTRVKHLRIVHPEGMTTNRVTFNMDAVPVSFVMELLSDISELPIKSVGDKGYVIVLSEPSPNHDAIKKLRKEASTYREADDKVGLRTTLKQIFQLAKPAPGKKAREPVDDLFAEYALLVIDDANTPHTQPAYLGQISQLESDLGPLDDWDATSLATVDAEDGTRKKQIDELALALLERYPNDKRLPESVVVMTDLETSAIFEEQLDDAERLSRRIDARLSDAKRSHWDESHLREALHSAAKAEQYLANTLENSKRYAVAEVHYQRLLNYNEARYGADSRKADVARDDVIYNAMWQKKNDRAAEYAARQIALSEKRSNPVSDHYALALVTLVPIRARQHDLAGLIPLWLHVIDLRRRVRGDNSAPVVAGLKTLAALYRSNAQPTEAAAVDRQIAAIGNAPASTAVVAKLSNLMEEAMSLQPPGMNLHE